MAESKDNSHVRGRLAQNQPNPVDVHVGSRMRLRRTVLGYTQQFMARKLGLTFQQVQKYEKGLNRIGASRLWDISKVLRVSMDFFYEDMDKTTQRQSPMMLSMPEEAIAIQENEVSLDPMHKQKTLELVESFYNIKNHKLADCIFQMLKIMSHSNSSLPYAEQSPEDIQDNVSRLIKGSGQKS